MVPATTLKHTMIINDHLKEGGNTVSVLFLGRSDCDATQKCLTHLKALGCQIKFVPSIARGEGLPEDIGCWHGDYIFCFRSLLVLPTWLIAKAKIAAINFHPGPVEYPGSGCINFALFDGVKQYGVTAHVMNEKVDNGPVLECRRFPVLPLDSVDTLLARTHLKLVDLFFDVVTDLVIGGKDSLINKINNSSNESWRGAATKIKDLEKLSVVPVDISEDALKRLIKATYTEKFPPYINIFGFRFILNSPNKTI
jgi:methionyl-tRNA formyltransferase